MRKNVKTLIDISKIGLSLEDVLKYDWELYKSEDKLFIDAECALEYIDSPLYIVCNIKTGVFHE